MVAAELTLSASHCGSGVHMEIKDPGDVPVRSSLSESCKASCPSHAKLPVRVMQTPCPSHVKLPVQDSKSCEAPSPRHFGQQPLSGLFGAM